MNNKEQQQELINKAYELRLRGMSFREIGRNMGVSHVTAFRWVTEHLENVTLPLVDEVRKTEVDRMMRYLKSLDDQVEEGDIKAITTALKVSERLCRMLGADMPTRTEVTNVEVTQVDMEIQELIRNQQLLNESRKAEAAVKKVVSASESNEGEGESNDQVK